MEIKAEIDFKKLKDAVKTLSQSKQIKVGLLSQKGGSEEISDNLDLAGLGAVHEFGTDIERTSKKGKDYTINIPARSFLEMPMVQHQADFRKKLKKLWGKDALEHIIEKGDYLSLAIAIGQASVNHIQDAFDSRGFGEWQENSPATIRQKGSDMPLIDTGNLRSHIDKEITNG